MTDQSIGVRFIANDSMIRRRHNAIYFPVAGASTPRILRRKEINFIGSALQSQRSAYPLLASPPQKENAHHGFDRLP